MGYKCLQFNAGRGSVATREILEYCVATKVLLIQEPQIIQQRVMGSVGRCFYKVVGDRLIRAELSDPDLVCVKIGKRDEKCINVISKELQSDQGHPGQFNWQRKNLTCGRSQGVYLRQ